MPTTTTNKGALVGTLVIGQYDDGLATLYNVDLVTSPGHIQYNGIVRTGEHYIYDPVDNIIHIRDDAQQTIFFRNKRVEPSGNYTYDSMYRLVKATGREHLGQVGGVPISYSYNDTPRVGLLHPNDGHGYLYGELCV
jgi:hypothetical protein